MNNKCSFADSLKLKFNIVFLKHVTIVADQSSYFSVYHDNNRFPPDVV